MTLILLRIPSLKNKLSVISGILESTLSLVLNTMNTMVMRKMLAQVSNSARKLMIMKNLKSKSRQKGLKFKAVCNRWEISQQKRKNLRSQTSKKKFLLKNRSKIFSKDNGSKSLLLVPSSLHQEPSILTKKFLTSFMRMDWSIMVD